MSNKITETVKGLAAGAFTAAAMATAVIGVGSIVENRIAAEGFLSAVQIKADKLKNRVRKPRNN